MADFIDDMISLDPAEVFEFSAAEIQAQIYDRLVTYPVDDVSKLEGLVAESWSVSDDGLHSPSRSARASSSTPATRSPPRTSPTRCSGW